MGNVTRSATPRPRAARSDGKSRVGSLIVGDHVGQPAATAAQAVRRAGLRPGLDRSFGHPTEETGRIVAQEPAAGSEITRNAMVTLYVAAPGPESAPAGEEPTLGGASPQPSVTDSSWERAAPPTGDDAATSQEGRPSEEPVAEEWVDAQSDAPTASCEPPEETAEEAANAREVERPSGWLNEPEDTFDAPVENPFQAHVNGQRVPGRLYPRTPAGLRIKHLAGQLRAHRRAAILVILLLAVLAAHGFAMELRRDEPGTAARSTGAPAPAAQYQAPEVRGKPAAARAKVAPVVKRHRHRQRMAEVSSAKARGPIDPPVAVKSAPPAPSTPQASGGPFSP